MWGGQAEAEAEAAEETEEEAVERGKRSRHILRGSQADQPRGNATVVESKDTSRGSAL